MDIQRKCFEESNNVNPDWSFKFDEELQQYIALDSEMELQVDEFNELWDAFRAGWQAAKAQADQKIKLLLCDEHLKKCESPTGVFNSQYPDEEPCLICLAKQYKAQAVPDGYVVVPMVPSERMINAVRQCYEGEAYLPYSLYSEFVNQAIIERIEALEPAK